MRSLLALVALVPFYLIGVFPSGAILARSKGVDITAVGSGNVGATNVARALGKRAGLITLLLDLTKGVLAVVLASAISSLEWYAAGAAVAVVCGHCFSLPRWLKAPSWFKGGKGVATAFGAMLALIPSAAFVALLTFAAVFKLSRIVSISSLSAALLAPLYCLVTNQASAICLALALISAVVFYRHRENINRLIEGREPRFQS
ncbi:MAG: glycerol-3-phosphate 1-O-acyltransferase PlsY [Pseudomonadota bacterium]|jgi:glycerol-3-phosphate acyltransferase PlsY